MKVLLLITVLICLISPSLTKKTFRSIYVRLTSSLQDGDTCVVEGKFGKIPAQIQMFRKNDAKCKLCQPIQIKFLPRKHRIQISKFGATETGGRRFEQLYNEFNKTVKRRLNFTVTIKVRSSWLEVKFNKQSIANIAIDDDFFDTTSQIRVNGATFKDSYVIPYDINIPAIYDPEGNNYWGNRRDFVQTRIIGGEEAYQGQFPWQAALRKKEARPWAPIKHLCGAVIISSCWVMTAAHCCNQVLDKRTYRNFLRDNEIRVGDLFNGKDSDQYVAQEDQQDLDIEHVFMNPEYQRGGNPVADIALIKLQKTGIGRQCIHYSDYVQPINLPPPGPNNLKTGTTCVVSGWGAMNWTDVTPPPEGSILMFTDVKVKDFNECRRNYSTNSAGEYKLKPGMFCAANPGKDTCQGDSGGPIYCPRKAKDEPYTMLSGITSWGEGCAEIEHPGVYADVGLYMNWIINMTGATTEKSPPRHQYDVRSMLP